MSFQTKFLLTGLIAGLVCVAPGVSWLMLLTLGWGVGPGFFAAVVAGIIITGARRHFEGNLLRYLLGLIVCCVTYLFALVVFFWVGGFSSEWFGFRPSNFASYQFGMDVFLGLLAAAVFAAGGIALFACVLTTRWSNSLFGRLLLAGIVTIVFTFIVNYAFHSYWSFYGVLVPLGSSLFCGAIGAHFWQHFESGKSRTWRAAQTAES